MFKKLKNNILIFLSIFQHVFIKNYEELHAKYIFRTIMYIDFNIY
jgi:hypothetical protein